VLKFAMETSAMCELLDLGVWTNWLCDLFVFGMCFWSYVFPAIRNFGHQCKFCWDSLVSIQTWLSYIGMLYFKFSHYEVLSINVKCLVLYYT
jgi:hypothetical protein